MKKLIFILFLFGVCYGQTFYYPVVVKKTLRVDKRVAIGMTDFTEDLNITADTILILGLDGTGNFLTIDGSGNVLRGTADGGSISGLDPTEGLYGADDGSIGHDNEWTYLEDDDLMMIKSDVLDAGYVVYSTDFSLFTSIKTSGIGVQGITHASNLTSEEIAAYQATHQFVKITPNPSSWDGYTNITGGNSDDMINWILPSSQGAANSFLKNNGSGTLTWNTISEYSTETAQDDISTLFTPDNGDIDFTYNDGTPDIAAQIKSLSIVNGDISNSAAIAYSKLALTGSILNADLAGSISYSKLSLTGAIVNADLAGSIDATKINTGAVSNTEFNYLDNVTSAIQTQLDNKGFVIIITGAQASIADATPYYSGAVQNNSSATADANRIYLPVNCTLKAGYGFILNAGTTGSGESGTFYVRKNDATDVAISSSVTTNAASTKNTFSGTGLSTTYSAGDYIEGKWLTPTYATNPTNCRWVLTLYFSPN